MGIPAVVGSLDEVLGQGVFLTLRVVQLGGVGGVVAVRRQRVEGHGRDLLVGIQIGDEAQRIGGAGRNAAGAQLQVTDGAGLQVAGGIGGVTLEALAQAVGDVAVLVGAEDAGAGVADVAIAGAGDEEAATGDGQIEGAVGRGQRAALADALGGADHFHAHGLGLGIQAAEVGTRGLEAHGAGVGDVVADGVELFVDGGQAGQGDIEAHGCVSTLLDGGSVAGRRAQARPAPNSRML